jgi:hypothetical protein
LRTALNGDRHFVSVVRSGRKRLAAIGGVEFGSRLDFIDGGAAIQQPGAQWYLMIEALKEFHRKQPEGVFGMGFVDVDYALDEKIEDGLLRFRKACQVTDSPTSVVEFRFQPTAAPLPPAPAEVLAPEPARASEELERF